MKLTQDGSDLVQRFDFPHSVRVLTRMAYHLEFWKSPRRRLVLASRRAIANAHSLRRDVSAVTSIEYALLASFIAVTIAGICSMMFGKLSNEYTEIANIFS